MHATRHRDVERRRAQMLEKQTTQVPSGDAEPVGERFDAGIVQCSVANESQRARDETGSAEPCRRAWRGFRTTAQTGAKSGRLSRRGRWKVADVLVLGGTGGTNGPTVDARGRDGDEKPAVEAGIARPTRTIADQLIELHPRRA